MITITVLKNPFNHTGKEIHTCKHLSGRTAYEYVQPYVMGLEDFVVSSNGNIVEESEQRLVEDGEWLAVCPVVGKSGRDWFRAIGMMAVGYYVNAWATNWSKVVAGANGLTFRAMNGFWANMAAGAVTAIGGSLVNHWFPKAKPDIPEVKPVYSWSNTQSLTGQGNALAVTYGTMRTAGQILAQHVSSKEENQHLNILLCGGEGPVGYYKEVAVETRLGGNDQPVISNFNDVYVDQSLAYELDSGDPWITHQTEGNAVQGLEITLQFPGGLYYVKDDGSLSNTSVTVQAQYRRVGTDDWQNLTSGAVTITRTTNTPFQVTYRVDALTADQYEVRARCVAKSGTSTRYSTRVFWIQLSSILYDDFARPGKVLVGVKALATNQLSGGVPAITWLQTRNDVWVWNPLAAEYQRKPATNPAWAAYDIIHRCRRIKNVHSGNYEFIAQGAPAARLVYQDFANWAAFCADRELSFNYIFTTASDLWTALQKPEGVGRGKVILRGTRYGCVCDAPGEPVQLFTVGNILTDKFQETFMGLKDRANAIEITFANKDKGYEKDVITAYADDYEAATEPNITQITLDGVTTMAQAYREGKYRLRLNRYLTRTVEHSADIDAIACQINDVVLLAHDVPQWGVSGRLLAATPTTLQLDREVTLLPGKLYSLALQITNPAAATAKEVQTIVMVDVSVVTEEVNTDTLTLANALETVPQQWDLYSFGETNKIVKPFRVLSISRDQDLRRKITCLEYIEEVYEEATDIPSSNDSQLETTPEVSSVSAAEETYRQKDGTVVSNLNVAWSIPRNKPVRGYKIFYSTDAGQSWTEWGAADMTALSAAIPGVKTQTAYLVKVCVVNYSGVVSPGVEALPVYISGKDVPPADISRLTAVSDPADRTKIILTWQSVNDIDLRGYQLREGATILTPTPVSDTRYVYTATESRPHTFSVVAIDNSANPSAVPATTIITVSIEPPDVSGFSAALQETDRSQLLLSWSAVLAQDLSYYEIRCGDNWDTAPIVATQLKSTRYIHQLTAEGYQTYLIKAISVAGYASALAATAALQVILRPDPPNDLIAVQETRDRSILSLSWQASPGKDMAGYEIFINSVQVATEKNNSHRWTIPASGTYAIAVRARTVAGYLSSAVNSSASLKIEADDVSGFTAVQQSADRTKVRLMWDASGGDVAYHEIRKGVSWDTGQIIGERVAGTFYDVLVVDEAVHTFWIKAVTQAGKYSQNPAVHTGLFNLNPLPVANIRLSQDPHDRSQLNITFEASPESDLANYEIRAGYVWQEASLIGETKELRWTYSPPATGDVKIMIKAKNAAGFYSDEASNNIYVTLEPGDVAGFRVFQNGERLVFVWNPVPDHDIVAYELREGGSFENGTIVATGITLQQYQLAVDTELLRRFHLKAINRSGRYSHSAASVEVLITDLQPKNVIKQYDELALRSGTHDGTEFGKSSFSFATLPGSFADYPTTKFADIGGATVLKLAAVGGVYPASGVYVCARKDLGKILTANMSTVFQPSILYTAGTTAALEYRLSRDASVWTDWQPFSPLEATFRYAEFRVILTTLDTAQTPEVNQLAISVDVPDKDIARSVVVPAGGVTVDYGHTYYEVPVVTPTAEGSGRAVWSNKTKSNVRLQVFNTAGADIGGRVDLRVKGY